MQRSVLADHRLQHHAALHIPLQRHGRILRQHFVFRNFCRWMQQYQPNLRRSSLLHQRPRRRLPARNFRYAQGVPARRWRRRKATLARHKNAFIFCVHYFKRHGPLVGSRARRFLFPLRCYLPFLFRGASGARAFELSAGVVFLKFSLASDLSVTELKIFATTSRIPPGVAILSSAGEV